MEPSLRSLLLLLSGVVLLAAAQAGRVILLESAGWMWWLLGGGSALLIAGLLGLRHELAALWRGRRGEIALFTAGLIGLLLVVAYLSTRYTWRYDMSTAGLHSLSEQTATMLKRLQKPVHVVFFHDPLMQKTVELYQLMAKQTDKLSVEFHDPMLNPAQARLLGVQFAGTSVMQSENRTLQIHGSSETDIANGILRVSQGAKQNICFLDGHGEADPFSKESHDHVEGSVDHNHSHGLGAQYVLHERHGMAKARHSLETVNYKVTTVTLAQEAKVPPDCVVLIVAGPKIALLDREITAIRRYLAAGGNALLMLEPFVDTGLDSVLLDYGVILDNTIVIDEASHFWADRSAPAVTQYNRHRITRELPLTFFPGVRSLSPTEQRMAGVNAIPLVSSSTNSYGETHSERAEFTDGEDLPGPQTLMVVLSRRPVSDDELTVQQLGPAATTDTTPAKPSNLSEDITVTARSRLAVVGDSDFATNSFFHFLGNGNLFLNTVNYLAEHENLIGLEPRTYDLPRLSVTNRQIKASFTLTVMLAPFLLAIVGIVVWWKQR